ncbi:MAG: 4-(cytidine 5'-diphospho)-2-C-methyl-D-erythritol kinase [Sporocytophaga sp.]|jgi:4-diphosphocytidyl-2-C-methyl-D-erythritol kinase|nr:4-(cytidine 5'-diphospho)-2-C-methyl-D-erythritol kinase [Sporocytophaga sp.]
MIAFPNAKINLGLNIVSKRPDGFHNLETCFYPVKIFDSLEILPSDQFEFTHSGLESSSGEDNLVIKTYRAMQKKYGIGQVKIHLHKAIPMGAGLGGGSSDAAFAVKLLNELFQLGLSANEMEDIVAPIGSDCPFFINNKPVIGKEKGNVFSPINLSLDGYFGLLIFPPFGVSTKEAYSKVNPKAPLYPVQEVVEGDISQWKSKLHNDFEDSVFEIYPMLKDIKEKLYSSGAIYACMSGSGSTMFGIFADKDQLQNISISGCTTFSFSF